MTKQEVIEKAKRLLEVLENISESLEIVSIEISADYLHGPPSDIRILVLSGMEDSTPTSEEPGEEYAHRYYETAECLYTQLFRVNESA